MAEDLKKYINIENIDNKGGTINFYVNDDKVENPKTIPIAACNNTSTALEGYVEISPWGEGLFQLSFRLTEKRNNQQIYQKLLVFKDESKAKELKDKVISVFEEIQTDATKRLKHSSFLIPKAYKMLTDLSKEADIGYNDIIDDSIRVRFDNNQFKDQQRDNPMPYGWVGEEPRGTFTQGVAPNIAEIIGAPTQYTTPGRVGVMAASKNNTNIKTAAKKIPEDKISNSIKLLYKQSDAHVFRLPYEIQNMTNDEIYHWFKDNQWSTAYGGEMWANIAQALIKLLEAKDMGSKMIWIDHIIDLQHNTGSVFNKDNDLEHIVDKIIAFKTSNTSIKEFVAKSYNKLSPEVRNLVRQFIRFNKFEKTSQTINFVSSDQNHLFYDFYALSIMQSLVNQYGSSEDKNYYESIFSQVLESIKDIFVKYLTYATRREARHLDQVKRKVDQLAAKSFDDIKHHHYDESSTEYNESVRNIAKSPRYAYQYARDIIDGRFPEGEQVIAKNAQYAYYYARDIIDGRFPEGEEAIAENHDISYSYAKDVLHGRFPQYEERILNNIGKLNSYVYEYIKNLIGSRWPELEQHLLQKGDPGQCYNYAVYQLQSRWPEAEPFIIKRSDTAYYYAKEIIKGPWPEAEDIIATDVHFAIQYAKNILHDRFLKAESNILTSANDTLWYAANIIKGRWPEGESIIAKNAYRSYEYAVNIIKGRFPEGEKAIATDAYLSYLYAKDILKEPFPEGEDAIIKEATYIGNYIRDVMKGPWPRYESFLINNSNVSKMFNYANMIKRRFIEAEPFIAKDVRYASKYAENIINGRFSEFEDYINTIQTNNFTFSELESILNYNVLLMRQRWPKFEELLLQEINVTTILNFYWFHILKYEFWPEFIKYAISNNDLNLLNHILEKSLENNTITLNQIRYIFNILLKEDHTYFSEEKILLSLLLRIKNLNKEYWDILSKEYAQNYMNITEEKQLNNVLPYQFNESWMATELGSNNQLRFQQHIKVIKFVRELTQLFLKETKNFVDMVSNSNFDVLEEFKNLCISQDAKGLLNLYDKIMPVDHVGKTYDYLENEENKEKEQQNTMNEQQDIISNSLYALYKLSSKKTFSKEEALEIAEDIGISWDVVKFNISDFIKGLNVEIEHDNDPQTDVVKDDKHKWEYVGKITWRHLKESPEYYKELSKMEKKLEV